MHKYPVPQRLNADDFRCSESNVGGHFNPYGVDVEKSPDDGVGTSDDYEIGEES